jgi:phage gp45-like
MDERLVAKVQPIERLAFDCGWDTERHEQTIDGCEAVQLVGSTVRGHPEASHPVEFGFMVCFGLNPDSGRAVTLCLDGKAGAKFVVMVDDGRYWYGPLSAYKRALDDPEAWTGVQAPEPISR